MVISDYHAKYFAYELTRQRRGGDVDRISSSLFDAEVDLNPHQIDAALFALQNPLSKGVLLADEVGLGKTIEAALVLCQYWAERRRRLIIICPASLRKQWANELSEKFQLPNQVLDAKTYNAQRKAGIYNPFEQDVISIVSYNYAARMADTLRTTPRDLVVIDEAHKLRNAHRDSNKTGQAIKMAFAGSRKLLLTATPLQNSLIELYGLSTVIDEQLFGDIKSFRRQFMHGEPDITGLRNRLKEFSKRTLRRQVLEYIKYTERKAITIPFTPSDEEQKLYDLLSAYLQRPDSYGIPWRQRHLVSLVIRKLLASSTEAVIETLSTLLKRLKALKDDIKNQQSDWLGQFLNDEDIDEEWLDELEFEESDAADPTVDLTKLKGEIAELEHYRELAQSIHSDAKTHALIKALDIGFDRMQNLGAARKAVIFTESRRTQDYLYKYLEQHGYTGKVACFSGSNTSAAITGIYQRWLAANKGSDKVTGSPAVDRRSAIIDHFKTDAEILIATEAAAEGINLQFCSLVINYDLPWNPQRVEQRIGRCHRYGQKHDVVVINFLNQRNEADRRVLELLTDKFALFDGVFGASDELIGRLDSGVDFEKRIATIYDTCRSPEEIQRAFDELQKELEGSIADRLKETESKLLENFDEQVHELLKVQQDRAIKQLDRIQRMFWQLTRFILHTQAHFNEQDLSFDLQKSLGVASPQGRYQLIQKGKSAAEHSHTYRLTHPLGEHVLSSGRSLVCPWATIQFDLSGYQGKISVLEGIKGSQGWLELNLLELDSFQREEHLVFSACTDTGAILDAEAYERLFNLSARIQETSAIEPPSSFRQQVARQLEATLSQALEENNHYFKREQEKLETWADEQIQAAEQALDDTKLKLRDLKRQARQAQSVEEQKTAQEAIKKLERQQREQRGQIFIVEDQIEERRDTLIAALEKRMHQQSSHQTLFSVHFEVI